MWIVRQESERDRAFIFVTIVTFAARIIVCTWIFGIIEIK